MMATSRPSTRLAPPRRGRIVISNSLNPLAMPASGSHHPQGGLDRIRGLRRFAQHCHLSETRRSQLIARQYAGVGGHRRIRRHHGARLRRFIKVAAVLIHLVYPLAILGLGPPRTCFVNHESS
jgi:hypothetical protein